MVWIFVSFVIGILLYRCIPIHKDTSVSMITYEDVKGTVQGRVSNIEEKENTLAVHLKDVSIQNFHCKKVLVYISKEHSLKIGYRIQVDGSISDFQKPGNPGQFDEYEYYTSLDYSYKVYAESVQIVDRSYSYYLEGLRSFRTRIFSFYRNHMSEQEAGLVGAMILGEKSLLDTQTKELYQQSGIAHILAISGLNVSFIGMLLYQILKRTGMGLVPATLAAIFVIYCYGEMTGYSISTSRAVVMLFINILAVMIGRTYDILSALALSACIVLVQTPLAINDCGFLLSFGAILGIVVIFPIFKRGTETWVNMDRKVSQPIVTLMRNYLLNAVCLSMSASISTLPIILYYFYEIPAYAVLVNIIVVPCMSLIVVLSMLAGLIGLLFPYIGMFLLGGVHVILVLTEWLCSFTRGLPGHSIITGRPSLMIIAIYYGIIGILVGLHMKNRNVEKEEAGKMKSRISLVICCLLPILMCYPRNSEALEITMLDVGQGDGIFVESPSHRTYLIDGGSTDVKQVGKYRLEPFLKYKGIRVLDYAIVTHVDSDHISGLLELIERYGNGGIPIKNLILPKTNLRDEAYESLISKAKQENIKIHYIQRGDKILDGDITMTCLHPYEGFMTDSRNAYSTVLSLSYGSYGMLFTGDIERDGEEELITTLTEMSDMDYDILKVAHHGSVNSTYEDFIEEVDAERALISYGEGNSYGHPHKELLDRLKVGKMKIYKTGELGAITIRTDGKKMLLYSGANPIKYSDEKSLMITLK